MANRWQHIPFTGLCIVFGFHCFAAQGQNQPDAIALLRKMFAETTKVRTLSYTMVKRERIKGNMITQRSRVKLALQPLRLYMYQEEPKMGIQVLYSEGNYNNKCVIHPNGFPWITLYLAPMHPRVLNNQHHNLYKSGYAYLVSILEHLMRKYEPQLSQLVSLKQESQWQGKKAITIALDNPNFSLVQHKVQKGEDAWTIAKEYMVCEYTLLERNPELSFYTPLPVGKWLTVPNDYARRMEITILKENMLPVVIKVFDELGLFEEYQYYHLLVNPTFAEEEFSKSNPNYSF